MPFSKILGFKHHPDQTKWLVFKMIHEKDSLLPMGKVWSLDVLDIYLNIYIYIIIHFCFIFRIVNPDLPDPFTNYPSKSPLLRSTSTFGPSMSCLNFHGADTRLYTTTAALGAPYKGTRQGGSQPNPPSYEIFLFHSQDHSRSDLKKPSKPLVLGWRKVIGKKHLHS